MTPQQAITAPLVSVVIPVHNRPDAVRRAIASVLAQTFQRFEIVVVDDGSTDATCDAVSSVRDGRVRLIRHKKNRGGSAARNTGIEATRAPFVAFLDSDDEWLPTKLERQLEVFARSPDTLGLVYTGAERTYPDGSVSRAVPRRRTNLMRELLRVNVVGETSLGMVRRSVLEALDGFDESLPSCQDLDLWLRISERFTVDVVPEVLVKIANGSDPGRITASVRSMMTGRAVYCRKHREKMIRFGVLHTYLRDSGWRQQRLVRDGRLARPFYVESISVRPIAPLTYVLLASTYLPLTLLDGMALCKRAAARLLGFGPETFFAEKRKRGQSATLQQKAAKDSTAL